MSLFGSAGLWRFGVERCRYGNDCRGFAGLVHGILVAVIRGIRENPAPNLHRLMIPAAQDPVLELHVSDYGNMREFSYGIGCFLDNFRQFYH